MRMGELLNREWKVGARKPYYHKDGTFFNVLDKFPGALFDDNGYIVFRDKDEFETYRGVHVGEKTNVPAGIWSLPGYVRMR